MTNLDLYAKAEHLLGIEDATEALHSLFLSELDAYSVNSVLDVGCGRGTFMERLQAKGIVAKGCDLSAAMVEDCQLKGLDVECADISEINGCFDAVVAIFDVLNFLDAQALRNFLEAVASRLNDDAVFIADINTKRGFAEVAEGAMSAQNEDFFLNVDATFANNELHTLFTLFEKNETGTYTKYQDTIIQYYHPLKAFMHHPAMKLVEKQTFSLYDTNDKTLLIMKKR